MKKGPLESSMFFFKGIIYNWAPGWCRDNLQLGNKYHLGYMIGCLGKKGMTYYTQVNSDYFINHDIRIPILNNQD